MELTTGFLSASSSFDLNGSLEFRTKFLDPKTIVYSTKNDALVRRAFHGGRRRLRAPGLAQRLVFGSNGNRDHRDSIGQPPRSDAARQRRGDDGGLDGALLDPGVHHAGARAHAARGKVDLGASLGMFFITIEGPEMPERVFKATSDPGFVDNATRTAYEPMVLFIPRISVSFPP